MTKEVTTTDRATVTVYTDLFNKRIRIDDYVGDLNEGVYVVKVNSNAASISLKVIVQR